MSRAFVLAAAFITAAFMCTEVSADVVRADPRFYGVWRTPVDGGGLARLEPCGERICGYVVDSPWLRANPDQRDIRNSDPPLRGRRVVGLKFMEARALAENRLGDGWVYHPEEGNTYTGTMTLLEDGRLRLTGCVLWPLCRTQIWRRVE